MSKLELQDAVDVGRHSDGSWSSLDWPRYEPIDDHHISAGATVLLSSTAAGLLSLFLPPIVWAISVGIVGACLILGSPLGNVVKDDAHYQIKRLGGYRGYFAAALVAFLAAAWFRPGLAEPIGIVLSNFMVGGLPVAVIYHYVFYATAHQNNTLQTQEKWRKLFSSMLSGFDRKAVKPARNDLTADGLHLFEQAVLAFSLIHWNLRIIAQAMLVLALLIWFDVSSLILAPVTAVLFIPLVFGPRRGRTWDALVTFLNSPKGREADLGTDPGWAPRSPLGTVTERQVFLGQSLFGFVLLHTPYLVRRLPTSDAFQQADSLWAQFQLAVELLKAGDYFPVFLHIALPFAAVTAIAMCFLVLLHIVAGSTCFHLHKLLDDDTPSNGDSTNGSSTPPRRLRTRRYCRREIR